MQNNNERIALFERERNDVETLIKLGLTALEAKIYLALIKNGDVTAGNLGKLMKIARSDVYRVAERLQEKGLVEKILETPIRFKAIPAEEGLKFLLRRKKDEYKKVEKETDQLANKLKENKLSNANNLMNEKFIIIPPRDAVTNRTKQAMAEVQESVDTILTYNRFFYGVNTLFREDLRKAWARGVKFRFILEKTEREINNKETIQFCKESGMCQIKFFNGQPEAVISIMDNKSVFIVFN